MNILPLCVLIARKFAAQQFSQLLGVQRNFVAGAARSGSHSVGFAKPVLDIFHPTVGAGEDSGQVATMSTLIITEKTSQASDLRAALGDRFGQILPAEGHLLRFAEPHEVNASWKNWACVFSSRTGSTPQGRRPRATSPPS